VYNSFDWGLNCPLRTTFLSVADIRRSSDEHHEFWVFCTIRRTEKEVGRTGPCITSMLFCISAGIYFYERNID